MKKTIILLLTLFTVNWVEVLAQTPHAFNYQAQITSSSGIPLSNRTVSFFITILQGSANGERAYSEFHEETTSASGLVSLQIGTGNEVFGNFESIDWGGNEHFLKIEIDENGGSRFRLLGISQLLSVPYALHAASADNVDDADADPTNELQSLAVEGNLLTLSNSDQSVDISSLVDVTDSQTLNLNGSEITISNGNTINLEPVLQSAQQTLTLNGNELSISGGNTITLPTSTGSDVTVPDPAQPVPISFRGANIYIFPIDNSEAVEFGVRGTLAGASSVSDGRTNTEALIAAGGDNGGTPYAAKICADLNAMGFEDWYLPSQFELDAIYKQTYLIQDFELDAYWSSTETGTNFSTEIDLSNGQFRDSNKNLVRRCRCVRRD